MAFKGNITKGSRVDAELQVSNDANGSALLAVSFADNGGGSGEDSVVVAPGTGDGCGVDTDPDETGRLVVFVDFSTDNDVGQLIVRVDGDVKNDEAVKGDTVWAYSLS